MNMTNNITLALLALGVSTLTVQAQDGPPPFGPPGGGPGGHRPPPLPLVQALDTNRDGIIDSNEIANASAELLTLDKNHDGQLTPDEYLPPLPPDAPTNAWRPPTPPIVKALDVNGDGIIDSNEIANASAELLTLDKNHMGYLTPNEYLGPRPHRHQGPPGGGPNAFGNQQGPPDNGQGPPDDGQGPPDNGQGPPDNGQGPPSGPDGGNTGPN